MTCCNNPCIYNTLNHSTIAIFRKLLEMTCQLAHVLKNRGVRKGNVVLIYMQSSPIAVAAMLACTRIGAIHRYTSDSNTLAKGYDTTKI